MYLVSKVIFNYKIIKDNLFEFDGQIWGLQGLKKTINEFDEPIMVKIYRNVKVMDAEAISVRRNNSEINIATFPDKHLEFIVSDKLMYPHDVRVLLKEKYGNALNWQDKKLDDNIPVLYSVDMTRQYGLRDKHGHETIQKFYDVNWRNLTDKDIVLNKNFSQVWPKKPKQPSQLVVLENFFAKTNSKHKG